MIRKSLPRHMLLSGVAAITMGTLANISPARALEFTPYVSLGGGFNFASTPSLSTSAPYYYGSSTPYPYSPPILTSAKQVKDYGIGGLALISGGLDFHNGWRVELEGSYRHSSGARFNVQAEGSTSVGVDRSTYALMANIWHDFALTDVVGAHLGGGLGVDSQSLHTTSQLSGSKTSTSSGGAGQLGLGVDFTVMPHLKLALDYRYFSVFSTQSSRSRDSTSAISASENLFVTTKDNTGDQSIIVSLRWTFGN